MNNIDILIFKMGNLTVGINCSEIIQVIINKAIIAGFIDFDSEEYRYYKLGEILNLKDEIEYKTLLLIEGTDNKKYSLHISSSLEVISAGVPDILIMPEFIRNKQVPFINWGFYEREDGIVMLITFNYYK